MNKIFKKNFLYLFILSDLYAQHGAQTFDPRIKSRMFDPQSQPGAPI